MAPCDAKERISALEQRVSVLTEALERLESDAHNHLVHGRLVDFRGSIDQARAALAQPQAEQRQFRYMNCNGGPIDPLELCTVCNGVGAHNQIHNPEYKP